MHGILSHVSGHVAGPLLRLSTAAATNASMLVGLILSGAHNSPALKTLNATCFERSNVPQHIQHEWAHKCGASMLTYEVDLGKM